MAEKIHDNERMEGFSFATFDHCFLRGSNHDRRFPSIFFFNAFLIKFKEACYSQYFFNLFTSLFAVSFKCNYALTIIKYENENANEMIQRLDEIRFLEIVWSKVLIVQSDVNCEMCFID